MLRGAEGGLPNEPAPKQEAKPQPKSASQEESSGIQQLVNTLFQALKQSMVISSETESRRNVRAPRVYSVGQNFKTGFRSFFSMQILYISNLQIVERIYLPCWINRPTKRLSF